jgi:hypothetical protein
MNHRINVGEQIRDSWGPTYGGLPYDMIASKFETTNLEIGEDMMDDYFRTSLKDKTMETTLFPSEQAFKSDSRAALNLRYEGNRAGMEPDQSDLFYGDTEPEPRRLMGLPNFMSYVDQIKERAKFSNFTADQSDFITDGGISENAFSKHKQSIDARTAKQMRINDYTREAEGNRLLLGPLDPREAVNLQELSGQRLTDYKESLARAQAPTAGLLVRTSQLQRETCQHQAEPMKYATTAKGRHTGTGLVSRETDGIRSGNNLISFGNLRLLAQKMSDEAAGRSAVVGDASQLAQSLNGQNVTKAQKPSDLIASMQQTISDAIRAQRVGGDQQNRSLRTRDTDRGPTGVDDRTEAFRAIAVKNAKVAAKVDGMELLRESLADGDAFGETKQAKGSKWAIPSMPTRSATLVQLESDGKRVHVYKSAKPTQENKALNVGVDHYASYKTSNTPTRRTKQANGLDTVANKTDEAQITAPRVGGGTNDNLYSDRHAAPPKFDKNAIKYKSETESISREF